MAPILCCCPAPCLLHSDNFNRDDANPPTGRWVVVSGEWEIESDRLRSISQGPIVTTVRQPPSKRQNKDYSIRIYFKALNLADGDTFGVICGYRSETDYSWVHFEVIGTAIWPTFYDHQSGLNTVVMDRYSHPGGIPFQVDTGGGLNTWNGKICYSLTDWTVDSGVSEESGYGIQNVGSEHPWTVGDQGGQASLPPMDGMVGFLFGEFDNFAFHQHWEAKVDCDFCSCLCINPNDVDDYIAFPEQLLVTFVPQFDPSAYPCSLNGATVVIHQVEIEGQTYLSPTKKVWTNQDIETGTNTPEDLDVIFRCNAAAGNAEERFTLGLKTITLSGTFRYGDGSIFVNSVPASYVIWEESTCDPINLVFGPLSVDPTTCETVEGGGGEQGWKMPMCAGGPTDGCRAPQDTATFDELAALEWKLVVTEVP